MMPPVVDPARATVDRLIVGAVRSEASEKVAELDVVAVNAAQAIPTAVPSRMVPDTAASNVARPVRRRQRAQDVTRGSTEPVAAANAMRSVDLRAYCPA